MLTGMTLPTVREAIIIIKVEIIERTFLSAVEEHTGVHAFSGDEVFSALFVFVLVSEANFSKWCTSAGIVHDVSHNTLNVTKEKIGLSILVGAFAKVGQL